MYQCKVKATRTHNAPCGCETPGTLHNRSWQIEIDEKAARKATRGYELSWR